LLNGITKGVELIFVIALDFDGTVHEHVKAPRKYPDIGDPVPYAYEWIRTFINHKADVFLWTCRDGDALKFVLKNFEARDIKLAGVNSYEYWEGFTTSRKLFANAYIDDAAAGVPLVRPIDRRPYLDWTQVGLPILDRIRNNQGRP